MHTSSGNLLYRCRLYRRNTLLPISKNGIPATCTEDNSASSILDGGWELCAQTVEPEATEAQHASPGIPLLGTEKGPAATL